MTDVQEPRATTDGITPTVRCAIVLCALWVVLVQMAPAQEAKRRWEMMNQIRRDKFDLILPQAMRENAIDMWITVRREGLDDPLYRDLGEGYVSEIGYYIFTDRGGPRVERAVLGIRGALLEGGGTYDLFEDAETLKQFIEARDPKRIGLNMSRFIGAADGLSHTLFEHLQETLGEALSKRFVSAEKLVSDFRSRRVASEIVAFGEAGMLSRKIVEEALSNRVVVVGKTTLEDVAWWMKEQLHAGGLGSSFGMPSVYVTGPQGIEAVSTARIIQPGDLIMVDWGVVLMNLSTDMKRIAYVLKPDETEVPPGFQKAFDMARQARDVIRQTIEPGRTAAETLERINLRLRESGFAPMQEFNKSLSGPETDVLVACHSVGNLGHGIGPSIAWFNPRRLQFELKSGNLLSIELFAYTAAPEWGGKKVRIPLEDDALVTERGVEWLYPVNQRILLIK